MWFPHCRRRSRCWISVSDLDKDGFLLNIPDGTYYLPDGLAGKRDHSPEDYITKITVVAPGDKEEKLWLDSLDTIFCGDAELIDYVQQIVGMAAVGLVYMEALIIAYGEGSNGKSTFWNTIAGVLGTYSGNMSADALTVGCKRNVKPELAEAKGKRLLIASELEEGVWLNMSIIKQLCSTDEIFAEKKYKDPFSFTPSHTLVLYTNYLPKVGAMDSGIWRRLIVIPFNAKITGGGEQKNYADYLVDHAAPYIMSWIIVGAEKAVGNRFRVPLPKCVEDAIAKYRRDNDWMSHFLEACCEVGDGLEEKSGEFYSAYRSYCARVGDFVRSTSPKRKTYLRYIFSKVKCRKCPLRESCRVGKGKSKERSYSITQASEKNLERLKFEESEFFRERMKIRHRIEEKNGELKEAHGLRRADSRGLFAMELQMYFTAFVANSKRIMRLTELATQ